MSTAVATKPISTPIVHKITWGRHTWVCINIHCDGYHHVYASCAR